MLLQTSTRLRIARHLSRNVGIPATQIDDFFFVVEVAESAEPECCRKMIGALEGLASGKDTLGVLCKIAEDRPSADNLRFFSDFVRRIVGVRSAGVPA